MFTQILAPTIAFICGIIIGYYIGCFKKSLTEEKRNVSNWGPAVITIVVTIVWAVSAMLDIALNTYETPIPIHGLMGALVGYFFNKELANRKK